ncbi:hypothetical protein NO1_1811 [Candidatus Termititenax aidoneus]|uniref:Uncharacterized protein n=1 Tax=Termititenax aidoneus TaxID=2218524 RepID=A0A388TDU4_TERA1|nr:hypothetical protein NO1_1811 [Candidatus Termititenax aidoneus]
MYTKFSNYSDNSNVQDQFWLRDYSSIWNDFLWVAKVKNVAVKYGLSNSTELDGKNQEYIDFSLVEFGAEKLDNFIKDVQKETGSAAVAVLTAYSILEGADSWNVIYANLNWLRIAKQHCKKALKYGVDREKILKSGEKILEKESAPQSLDAAITLVLAELDKIGREVKIGHDEFGREILYVEKYYKKTPEEEKEEKENVDKKLENFKKYKTFNGFLASATDWLYGDNNGAQGDCRMLSFLPYLVLTELGFKVDMYRIGVIDKGARAAHAHISVNELDKEPTASLCRGYAPGSLIHEQQYNVEYSPLGLAAETVSMLAQMHVGEIERLENVMADIMNKEQHDVYLLGRIDDLLKDVELLEVLLKYMPRSTTILDNISYVYASLGVRYKKTNQMKEALSAYAKAMEYAEKEIEIFYQYKIEAKNKEPRLKAAAIKRLDEEIKCVKNTVAGYYKWYIEKGGQNFTRRFP